MTPPLDQPRITTGAPRGRAWKRLRATLLLAYVAALVASWVWTGLVRNPPGNTAAPWPNMPTSAEVLRTTVPCMTSAGPTSARQAVTMAACHWQPRVGAPTGLPVILLHGGPGRGRDFDHLATLIADRGRDVYAPDLLGFGDTDRDVPDYSILANAHTVIAWMDANGIARAHVFGWSQGGGVALHVADLQPARVASLTLLSSIGMQETEGSRSYAFEHARYSLGDFARRSIPWLFPHFGSMQEAPPAFTRYFADSDQRPLRDVMRRLRAPTMVLHGRRDFLVNQWAARMHHDAIGTSTLVMTGNTHFVPFWPAAQLLDAANRLVAFWTLHDDPHAVAPHDTIDLAPVPRLFGRAGQWAADRLIVDVPWWAIAATLSLLWSHRAMRSRWTVALAAMLVVTGLVDYGLAWVGITIGAWVWFAREAWRGWRTARQEKPAVIEEWQERFARGAWWAIAVGLLRTDLREEIGRAVGVTLRPVSANSENAGQSEHTPETLPPTRVSIWEGGPAPLLAIGVTVGLVVLAARQLALLIIGLLVISPIVRDPFHPMGEFGVILALIAARIAIGFADLIVTIPGRRQLAASILRATRFEFWPTWLIYLGLAPMFIRCAIKSRHPLAFTACNPGIENGGGIVGESKFAILSAMRRDATEASVKRTLIESCCRTWPIEPGDAAYRAAVVDDLVHDVSHALRYPVILKPDIGHRGFSVRVARSRDDVEAYFRLVPGRVLVQPWHAGPGEVGVVWMKRTPQSTKPAEPPQPDDALSEHIFSITLKQFSFLEGDGEHTVEQLVYRHPRYRLQARRFLSRLAGQRLHILPRAQRLPIALAGNHCQGTLFRDGAHLITPELENSIDAICRCFRGRESADGLDAVRMDIRYRSEDDLRAGRLDPDSIIELNGTLGETTNIYDPDKPLSWSYDYLRRQWESLYTLGRARMNAGHRPLSMWTFFRILARNRGELRGSDLSD